MVALRQNAEWEAAVTLRIFMSLRSWEVTTESAGLLCTEALAQVMEMAWHRVADDHHSEVKHRALQELLQYIEAGQHGMPVSRLKLEALLLLGGYWNWIDKYMFPYRAFEDSIPRGQSQDLKDAYESIRAEYIPKLKNYDPAPSSVKEFKFPKLSR